MTVDVDDTLGFLLGTWSVHRRLVDADGSVAEFRGTGVFSAPSSAASARLVPSAHYEEAGHVVTGSYSGPAERRLDYVRSPDGRHVEVRFCDGRPFIGVDLTGGHSTDRHLCEADDYEISTRVVAPDLVEERWRVRGPSKRYDAVTTMRRLTGSGAQQATPPDL